MCFWTEPKDFEENMGRFERAMIKGCKGLTKQGNIIVWWTSTPHPVQFLLRQFLPILQVAVAFHQHPHLAPHLASTGHSKEHFHSVLPWGSMLNTKPCKVYNTDRNRNKNTSSRQGQTGSATSGVTKQSRNTYAIQHQQKQKSGKCQISRTCKKDTSTLVNKHRHITIFYIYMYNKYIRCILKLTHQ